MTQHSNNPGFTRRGFLGFAGLAITTAGLAACSSPSGGGGGGGAAASSDLKLPTYKEFGGIVPDLPGNSEGLQSAFFRFPSPSITTVKTKPLTKAASGLTETFDTMSPGMKDNAFWQRLNQALGADLKLQIAEDIGDGYPGKFATVLASADLPDLMWIPPNQGIPNISRMLDVKFQDLTKYLSGDAVLEYPNLAALRPDSWRTAVVDGKIWGAPIPSTPFGQVMTGRRDIWAAVGGLTADNAEDFLAKAKELTRPADKLYAFEPAYINVLNIVSQMYGAPNTWAVNKDRSLTHVYETEEYAASVEFVAKMFAAGVFYPDANITDTRSRVANGLIGAQVVSGPHDLKGYRGLNTTDSFDILIPFSADGKVTPAYRMGYGTVGFTAFAKADESKIRELLALVNYLSAPFGSAEYLQKNFGTQGKDHTLDGQNNPVLTESGQSELPGLVSALNIMTSPENVLFSPGFEEETRYVYEQEKKLLEIAWRNPTNGIYSDAQSKLGGKVSQPVQDKVVDIITGRASMSELKAAVARWKKDGGDKIRHEYESQLPASVPVFKN